MIHVVVVNAHLDYVSQIIKAGVGYRITLFALLLKVLESLLIVEVLNVSILYSRNDLRLTMHGLRARVPGTGVTLTLNQIHSGMLYN